MMRARTTPAAVSAALALGVALLVSACQAPRSDRGGAGGGAAGTGTKQVNPAAMRKNVDVVLREMEIMMPRTLEAGPTTFQVRNTGTMVHSFEVEGQGIEKKLDQPLQPNEQATLQVDLEPGRYRVYCPVDQHAGRGMELQLIVTPRPRR